MSDKCQLTEMLIVRIHALVWQEAKAQQQEGKSIVRQLTWLRIVFRCPSRCCNSSIHFELNLSVYRSQKYYNGVESLGKGLTVINVLSRESTTLPSGKLGAMQSLCCSQRLLWWAGSMRAANIRGCTVTCLTVTFSHLCALPCWRGLENSRELYQGHPSKPHMLLHQSFTPLCVKRLLQRKPIIKGSLMPMLQATNCSVYIFPKSLRKPTGFARYPTSLSHT